MRQVLDNPRFRYPLMALGMLALLAGLWSGLLRMGWSMASPQPTLVMMHGPLMVCGFLGTLISIERAVALGRVWAYTAPIGANPLWWFFRINGAAESVAHRTRGSSTKTCLEKASSEPGTG